MVMMITTASTKIVAFIALGKGFSVLVQKAIIHRVKMYQLCTTGHLEDKLGTVLD